MDDKWAETAVWMSHAVSFVKIRHVIQTTVSVWELISFSFAMWSWVTHADRWEMLSLSPCTLLVLLGCTNPGRHLDLGNHGWGCGFWHPHSLHRGFFWGRGVITTSLVGFYSLCCSQTQSWTFLPSSHLLMYCCLFFLNTFKLKLHVYSENKS